jgi:cyclohexyl-isocyanide hydratase
MPVHIGFLLFPAVQQLDLTGPYEVFASVADAQVHLIWKDLVPVKASTGLMLQPTTTLADCPALDVLCIPGGSGVNALLCDEPVLRFVRQQAGQARFVTSVCTGALVLGVAGLLQGKRAATHWNAMDFLPRLGATPVHERVVRDGRLITAGGVTSGIDFGLTVIAELWGESEARAVQLALEYAPAPPFEAGTPEQAGAETASLARQRMAVSRAQRQELLMGEGVCRLALPA